MGETQKTEPIDDAPAGPVDLSNDRYMVPGLVRGLRALAAFTPDRRDLSLAEIAAHLGTTRSAAFRTVYTLTQLGYLLNDHARKTYALGPAVLRLGYGFLATRELVEIASPEIERLRDEIDWSTHLGVRDGRSVLYVLRAPSRMGLASIVHVGSRLPASSTTMGRVLLADLDEETLTQLYRDETYERSPAATPQSTRDLLAQWRRDRSASTVTQVGAFETGIAAVAAPVRDLSGRVVAAINATRPTREDLAHGLDGDVARHVRATADRISRLLGVEP